MRIDLFRCGELTIKAMHVPTKNNKRGGKTIEEINELATNQAINTIVSIPLNTKILGQRIVTVSGSVFLVISSIKES